MLMLIISKIILYKEEKQLAAKYMEKGIDIYKGMGLILKESI